MSLWPIVAEQPGSPPATTAKPLRGLHRHPRAGGQQTHRGRLRAPSGWTGLDLGACHPGLRRGLTSALSFGERRLDFGDKTMGRYIERSAEEKQRVQGRQVLTALEDADPSPI